ncbi:pyrroloquinoline quinone precursor peptide PqqA [Methylophaga nitratireducenticrescens]|nr:pyrroloquinoline quinone precursor peptide PqqA [Methylophaga nitratireducenticrescens]
MLTSNLRRMIMWTKPEYSDMRFGFEVTMYICNR